MSGLKPGVNVVVTSGQAQGLRGRLVQRAEVRFGGTPVWAVEFDHSAGFPHLRAIREDYLRPVEEAS